MGPEAPAVIPDGQRIGEALVIAPLGVQEGGIRAVADAQPAVETRVDNDSTGSRKPGAGIVWENATKPLRV